MHIKSMAEYKIVQCFKSSSKNNNLNRFFIACFLSSLGAGYGDYPRLEEKPIEQRDIYYPYDFPEMRRNFQEPVSLFVCTCRLTVVWMIKMKNFLESFNLFRWSVISFVNSLSVFSFRFMQKSIIMMKHVPERQHHIDLHSR